VIRPAIIHSFLKRNQFDKKKGFIFSLINKQDLIVGGYKLRVWSCGLIEDVRINLGMIYLNSLRKNASSEGAT